MGEGINNKDSEIGNQFNKNNIENVYLGINSKEKNYSILSCKLYNTKLSLKEEINGFNKYCIDWQEERILILNSLHKPLQNIVVNRLIQKTNVNNKYELKRLLPKTDEDDKQFDIQFIINADIELNDSIVLLTLESGRNAKIFLNQLFGNNESLSETLKSRNILVLCQIDDDTNDLYEHLENEVKSNNDVNDSESFPFLHLYLLNHLSTILSAFYGNQKKIKELSQRITDAWKNEKFSRDEQELYRFLFQDLTINTTYNFEQKLANIGDDKISTGKILNDVNDKAEQIICLTLFYVVTSFPKLTFREFKDVVEFLLAKYGTIESIVLTNSINNNIVNSSMESLMIEMVRFMANNNSNKDKTTNKEINSTSKINLLEVWKVKADDFLNQCFIGLSRENDSGKEFIQFTLPYLKEDIKMYLNSNCRTLVDRNTKMIVFNKFLFTEKFSDTFTDAIIQIIIDRLKADKHYWGTFPITRLILPLVDTTTIHKKYGLSVLDEAVIEDLDITKEIAIDAFVSLFKDKHLKPFFNLLFGLLNDKETQNYVKSLFNILINEGLGVVVLELLKFRGYPTHFDKVFWIKQIIHRGGVIKDLKSLVDSLELQFNAYQYLKALPIENVSNIYEVLERIRSEWWNSNDDNQLSIDDIDIVINNEINEEDSTDEDKVDEEVVEDNINDGQEVETDSTEKGEAEEVEEEGARTSNESYEKPITDKKKLKLSKFLYDFSYSILNPLPNDLYGIYPPVYHLFTSFTNDENKSIERFEFLVEWLFHVHLDTVTYNEKISSNDFLWGVTTEKPKENFDKIIYQDKKREFYILQKDFEVKPQNADLIEGWYSVLVGYDKSNTSKGEITAAVLIRTLQTKLNKKQIRYLTKIWGRKKAFYIKIIAALGRGNKELIKPIQQRKNNLRQLTKLIKNT